jgi:hypothetical protein
MTNDESKKQNDEQTKLEASSDNSISDADLELVAGGTNYNNFGTRTAIGNGISYFRRR